MGDLHGAEVDVLLLVGEGESAGSEADDAEKYEEKSDDGCGFQWVRAFPARKFFSNASDVMRILL